MTEIPADVLLREAGWSPRRWAAEINNLLVARGRGRDRIHPTSPYHWIRSGRPPRDVTLAATAVEALSIRLGRTVPLASLWPGTAADRNPSASCASDGLLATVSRDSVLIRLDALSDSGARYHRAPGRQLLLAAHDGSHGPALGPLHATVGDRVHPPMLAVIRGHIVELRRLDDQAGGGVVSLRYVRAELTAVLDLVRHAAYRADVGQQLLAATAELCQLAGWMWFDGGDVGTAQRAFLLGIRLARAAEDTDALANMLGMLAYITAHDGEPATAIRLASTRALWCAPVDRRSARALQAGWPPRTLPPATSMATGLQPRPHIGSSNGL